MKNLFVPYDIMLKLEEKGYDKPFQFFSNTAYYSNGAFNYCNDEFRRLFDDREYVLAPLYQQVVDWFREKHGIIIDVRTIWINKTIGLSEIDSFVPYCNYDISEEYDDYYEALTRAIEEAVKLI